MSERKRAGRPQALVTLEQVATVLVGLDDGLPLEELLAYAAIPKAAWPGARAGWDERLVADLARGGSLAAELHRAKVRALAGWQRRIEPLDRELRAYLDFERALGAATDQASFLTELGLRPADPLRLAGLWAERLREPRVQSEALAILNEPPGALPPIETSAARVRLT